MMKALKAGGRQDFALPEGAWQVHRQGWRPLALTLPLRGFPLPGLPVEEGVARPGFSSPRPEGPDVGLPPLAPTVLSQRRRSRLARLASALGGSAPDRHGAAQVG